MQWPQLKFKKPTSRHFSIGLGGGLGFPGQYETSLGLALNFGYLSDSGWGLQTNMGAYVGDDSTGIRGEEFKRKEVSYLFPIILRYQLRNVSEIAPFAGLGLSYGKSKIVESSGSVFLGNLSETVDKWEGIAPLVTVGVFFSPNSPIQFGLDIKYFINPHNLSANLGIASVSTSINW